MEDFSQIFSLTLLESRGGPEFKTVMPYVFIQQLELVLTRETNHLTRKLYSALSEILAEDMKSFALHRVWTREVQLCEQTLARLTICVVHQEVFIVEIKERAGASGRVPSRERKTSRPHQSQ